MNQLPSSEPPSNQNPSRNTGEGLTIDQPSGGFQITPVPTEVPRQEQSLYVPERQPAKTLTVKRSLINFNGGG